MNASVEEFSKQVECIYKDSRYSVRDNGAVLRHPRQSKSPRKLDNKWTFGTPNNNGYLVISGEIVHRIVACAFLGEPPTPKHIIDHLDTNRQNNRPENLRWLTKLENILNNPITVKRIIYRCGSIEAFLKDPSILKNYEGEDPNYSWMRAVSPEEARISWENLNNWATKEKPGIVSSGGSLGEWIFNRNTSYKKTENDRLLEEQINPERIKGLAEMVLLQVENETGINRVVFSSKSKKKEYLDARIYAARLLREKVGLSEESIGKLIGKSKSMVNTYLNYTKTYTRAEYEKIYGKLPN